MLFKSFFWQFFSFNLTHSLNFLHVERFFILLDDEFVESFPQRYVPTIANPASRLPLLGLEPVCRLSANRCEDLRLLKFHLLFGGVPPLPLVPGSAQNASLYYEATSRAGRAHSIDFLVLSRDKFMPRASSYKKSFNASAPFLINHNVETEGKGMISFYLILLLEGCSMLDSTR